MVRLKWSWSYHDLLRLGFSKYIHFSSPQFDGEMTFFCTWRAAFRKFFDFPAVFHSVHVKPIFPSSASFSWISNVWRRLLVFNWSHSIDPWVVEFERRLHPAMLAIRSSNFFGGFPRSSFLTSKSPLLNFLNTQSTVIYQEHAHRKLRQAFDAILQQFSSTNRKSMLSANRSFQAQNSTCSMLLQTILLYETCCELKIFVRCQNKEMASMAPSDGNYIFDSYGHLLINSVSYLYTWYYTFNQCIKCVYKDKILNISLILFIFLYF